MKKTKRDIVFQFWLEAYKKLGDANKQQTLAYKQWQIACEQLAKIGGL